MLVSDVSDKTRNININYSDDKVDSKDKVDFNYISCIPVPGKPNPYESSSLGIHRSRVKQSKQKGQTCLFYALQILRNEKKIGKWPADIHKSDRLMEKLFSEHRKLYTAVDAKQGLFLELATAWAQTNMENEKTHGAHWADTTIFNEYLKCEALLKYEFGSELASWINNGKLNGYDGLIALAKENYMQAIIDIDNELLLKLTASDGRVDIHKCYEEACKKYSIEPSIFNKTMYFQYIIRSLHLRICGAKKSTWHPEQSIDNLMEQLKLHGPLLAVGKFGQLFYEDPSFDTTNKIEGRPIFGWKPNAKRREGDLYNHNQHAVVIVAAQKINGKEYIYFIDPVDGSDPADLGTQKIYIQSYEKLRSFISANDFSMGQTSMQDGKPVFAQPQKEGESAYAYYIPRENNL